MALNIKNPEADQLARQLAATTGESLSEAILKALRERLARERGRRPGSALREEIARMQARIATLPLLDGRSDDQILGYDPSGTPR